MPYSPIKKDGTPKLKPGRKPVPKVKSTWVRKAPRPEVWIVGPDEDRHRMYHPWQMARAQANFRGEPFELTFEEFYQLWRNDWDNRGRQPENMCMTRKDKDGPWSADNVHIITRKEHLIEQGGRRTAQGMRYNRKSSNSITYKKMKVQQ